MRPIAPRFPPPDSLLPPWISLLHARETVLRISRSLRRLALSLESIAQQLNTVMGRPRDDGLVDDADADDSIDIDVLVP